jgi:hypothetical protein
MAWVYRRPMDTITAQGPYQYRGSCGGCRTTIVVSIFPVHFGDRPLAMNTTCHCGQQVELQWDGALPGAR